MAIALHMYYKYMILTFRMFVDYRKNSFLFLELSKGSRENEGQKA
jgi:hypothetical protein